MDQEPKFNYQPPSGQNKRGILNNPAQLRRLLIWGVAILAVIVIGFTFFNLTNTAKLVVTAEEGSTISIATEKGGEFSAIGTTSANYTTRDEGDIYVRIDKDGSATITTATLIKRQTVEINPALEKTQESSRIADGSLSSLYFAKDFIYGVNPSTNSPDYVAFNPDDKTYFSPFGLPQIQKAAFQNENYFIYKDLIRENVGVVQDRSITQNLTGYQDFITLDRKGFLLLGDDGLYTLDKKANRAREAQIDRIDEGRLFASGKDFFATSLVYAPVPAVEEDREAPSLTKLFIFDDAFTLQSSHDLNILTPVSSVVKLPSSDKLLLVAAGTVFIFDPATDSLEGISYYFNSVRDVTAVDGRILVLATGGLWQYETENAEFKLVSAFPDSEKFVTDSLTLSEDGKSLFYSTLVGTEARRTNPTQDLIGGIYRIDL